MFNLLKFGKVLSGKILMLFFAFMSVSVWGTTAFVVNSVSQTLSQLEVEQQQANNDFAELGEYPQTAPNKMAFNDNFAYVVITYENRIQKIDLGTGSVRSFIFLEDSAAPNDIFIANGFAYVSGNGTNKVYKINLAGEEVETSAVVGLAPQGLCVFGNALFVANTGFNMSDWSYAPGTVSVVALTDFSVIDTISVDLNPANIAVVNNKIHVVCTGDYASVSGKIDVVDPQNYEIENVLETGDSPASIAVGNNGKVYLGNIWPAGVFVYDAETLELEITPADNIFYGGNQVATNEQYLAVIDAVDYVQNSVVRFYDLQNNQLLYQMEIGVGATDVKFYETSAVETEEIAQNYEIYNYPNPFRNFTTISFFEFSNEQNQQNEQTTLLIYNIKGQKVTQLGIMNYELGINRITWDGTDDYGKPVNSGIYFYKLNSFDNSQKMGKMILVR